VGSNGKTVWRLDLAGALQAKRLNTGNTLVLCLTPVKRIVEIDRDGKMVWETFVNRALGQMSHVLPLVRLGFDTPRPPDLNLATSIPYRLQGFKSKSAVVRYASARALEHLGPKAEGAIPDLIEALDDADPSVREAVSGALQQVGPKALPALLAASKDPHVNIRASAINLLGDFPAQAEEVLPILVVAFNDKQIEVRHNATRSLARLGPKVRGVVPAFVEGLGAMYPDVREKAVG
jgi:hypothetical protein